jgi:hypothetical protein
MAEIEIDLQQHGVDCVRIYADTPAERESGLRTLLEISPELERIQEKLGSQGAGSKALGQS